MAENALEELEYRLLLTGSATSSIADGDLSELVLESEVLTEVPETKPAPTARTKRHRNEPSLEEADYFADYDVLVDSRLQVIIVAKSGKKAQFGNVTDLEILLQPYADANSRPKDSPLEPMWIDIQYPTEETMSLIMRLFGVHPLTAEDCMIDSEKEQQKFEIFETYRFISFAEHHAIPGTNIWSSIDVHMILPTDSSVLIVLHNGPVSYIAGLLNRTQALSRVKNPLRSGKGVQKRLSGECAFPSPEWLVYAILDQIVDQFLDLVFECTIEVERLEELVYILSAREQTDFLRRIGAVRNRMVTLRLQLLRKNDVVKGMLLYASELPISLVQAPLHAPQQKTVIRVGPHTRRVALTTGMKNVKVFIRDIQDHIIAMLVDLEQGKEELLAIANTFTARVSTQLSLADKEQNQLLKLFNALAAIVLPLTFVTALFGMNCPVPWKDTTSLRAFGGILGTLIGSGVLGSIAFWALDWF